ncbi:MAG: hypothetical protein IJB86_06505 [Clostridia bacterium]|nr:hypothetical protein [Clostridia bacterium]
MIGLGKWSCRVDTMMFRGTATLNIYDNNGEYGFELDAGGLDIPEVNVSNIVENGNTLEAVATTPALPGKEVPISLEFDGDVFTGFLKVPFIGKVKLKDGKRIG